MRPISFSMVLILFITASCNYNAIYDEQVLIDGNSWPKDQAANFEVNIEDTVSAFDFYLNFRNTTDYRYSNLFIFLITKFPDGKISRDTIECLLADKSGRWLGKGWGNLKETDLLLQQNLTFPFSGKYEFLVIQAMRDDTLKGISNVGLSIENTN